MAIIRNLDAAVGANWISDATAGAAGVTFSASTVDAVPVRISRATIGAATIGVLALGVSGASIPVFQFSGTALVSAVTIKFITGGVAGTFGVRITNQDGSIQGWIPVLPDGAVTGAAAA